MQAEQLMIGDWVLDPFDEPTRISAIHNFDDVEINKDLDSNQYFAAAVIDLNPVPITGGILERNGFSQKPYGWRIDCDGIIDYRIKVVKITGGRIRMEIGENNTNDFFISFVAEFVHELQHALRLCGIKKDIVL